jgi:hypothetical protein
MELNLLMSAFDYKVSDGDEYLWKCYPNARFINFESDYAYISVVHSTQDTVVYEVTVESKNDEYAPVYRWMNPDFIDAHEAESKERKLNPNVAWDDVCYTDVEDRDDFLIKAGDVFNGVELKTDIEINLPHDVLLEHLLAAHKQDITFNEYVNAALRRVIEETKVGV